MKIGETKETCDQILKEHIPLLKMIDQKIDNDMDKVLNKMDALNAGMNTMKGEMKSEMSTMKGEMKSEMSTMTGEMSAIKSEMGTMHKLLWTFIFTLLGILLAGIVSFFIASYFR